MPRHFPKGRNDIGAVPTLQMPRRLYLSPGMFLLPRPRTPRYAPAHFLQLSGSLTRNLTCRISSSEDGEYILGHTRYPPWESSLVGAMLRSYIQVGDPVG